MPEGAGESVKNSEIFFGEMGADFIGGGEIFLSSGDFASLDFFSDFGSKIGRVIYEI